jgi:hypothetical protein
MPGTLATPKRMQAQTPSHARAKVQEQATAKRIGGRQTKGSGSGYERGDVRLKGFLRVENKTTKHSSFSVTKEVIEKLEASTFGSGEVPVLQVELGLGECRVLVMPDWALDLIVDALKGREGDRA